MKLKNKYFLRYLVHVFLPIAFGAVIYVLMRPDTYVSSWIYKLLGLQAPEKMLFIPRWLYTFITGHAADILWAYSLSHAVFWILDGGFGCWLPTIICFTFAVSIESMQLLPFLSGTFDWWDILLEICTIAMVSLKINLHREARK